MADAVKVYKVRNKATGEFRSAGGSFNKTGKTWNNLGHLKSSIAAEGWYRDGDTELPDDNIEIVEVVVRYDEGNVRPMKELIIAERRKRHLAKKFGSEFAALIERIEEAGQNNDFQWVLIVDGHYNWQTSQQTGDIVEMLEIIKRFKLKHNRDYKKSTTYNNGGAFAFASKQVAMMARLQIKGNVQSVDIVKYVETNLDEEDSSSV